MLHGGKGYPNTIRWATSKLCQYSSGTNAVWHNAALATRNAQRKAKSRHLSHVTHVSHCKWAWGRGWRSGFWLSCCCCLLFEAVTSSVRDVTPFLCIVSYSPFTWPFTVSSSSDHQKLLITLWPPSYVLAARVYSCFYELHVHVALVYYLFLPRRALNSHFDELCYGYARDCLLAKWFLP